MRGLFLLFIIVPIVEMLLLFEVSDHIGAMNTIFLVVLTAVIGIRVLKQQGLATFARANQRLRRGELPGQEIIEGLFLAVGGAFLLTPGFITDTLGFIFLIGPTRRFLCKALIKSGKLPIYSVGSGFQGFSHTEFTNAKQTGDEGVYEGEYTKENPDDSKLDGPGES